MKSVPIYRGDYMSAQENESITENPDQLPFIEQKAERHPPAEMFLIRQAIDRALTHTQRELWALRCYDRLTEAEIAHKLHVSQQAVSKRLAVIENKIITGCQRRKNMYKLMKLMEKLEGAQDE